MPRPAKPYPCRGWYVTNLGGKRHRLCPLEDGPRAAAEALSKLQQELRSNGGRPFPTLTVAELGALFLESVQVERTVHTYLDYRRWLLEFARRHGHRQVREITRQDAQQFRNEIANGTWVRNKQSAKPYKPRTVNHAIIALKRCWNWGIETELVPSRNPFDRLPLLDAEGRQRVVTDEEFQKLLRHSSDSCFRRVLIALRYTSARPGEVRGLTWANVDWENRRWVIHRHKSSRTARVRKPKLIPMCLCVERLLRWLHSRSGHQPHVFLNSEGRAWTKDAFVQRMESLRRRAGIVADENGENLPIVPSGMRATDGHCDTWNLYRIVSPDRPKGGQVTLFVLYHHRHTFLTVAASSAGISGPMLQQLAGHTDPRTTERYAHLANRDIHQAGMRVVEGLRPHRPGK